MASGRKKLKDYTWRTSTTPIYITEKGSFQASYDGADYESPTLAELEANLRMAMSNVLDLDWKPMILVKRPEEEASNRTSGITFFQGGDHIEFSVRFGLKFFRCEVAYRRKERLSRPWLAPDGMDDRRADYIARWPDSDTAEDMRREVAAGKTWQQEARRQGRDTIHLYVHEDDGEYLIPYSEEVWLMLMDIRARVEDLSRRLHHSLGPDRIALLAAGGGVAGLLAAPAPAIPTRVLEQEDPPELAPSPPRQPISSYQPRAKNRKPRGPR